MKTKVKIKFALYQDNDFGQETYDAVIDQLSSMNLALHEKATNKPTDTDLTSQITKLKNADCEAVAMALPSSSLLFVSSLLGGGKGDGGGGGVYFWAPREGPGPRARRPLPVGPSALAPRRPSPRRRWSCRGGSSRL